MNEKELKQLALAHPGLLLVTASELLPGDVVVADECPFKTYVALNVASWSSISGYGEKEVEIRLIQDDELVDYLAPAAHLYVVHRT